MRPFHGSRLGPHSGGGHTGCRASFVYGRVRRNQTWQADGNSGKGGVVQSTHLDLPGCEGRGRKETTWGFSGSPPGMLIRRASRRTASSREMCMALNRAGLEAKQVPPLIWSDFEEAIKRNKAVVWRSPDDV